jgi:hypothetical protein
MLVDLPAPLAPRIRAWAESWRSLSSTPAPVPSRPSTTASPARGGGCAPARRAARARITATIAAPEAASSSPTPATVTGTISSTASAARVQYGRRRRSGFGGLTA